MEVNIEDLTKEELLNPELIPQVFENYEDDNERHQILDEIYKVAKDNMVLTKVKKNVQKCESEYKMSQKNEVFNILMIGINGKPEPTIENEASNRSARYGEHIRFASDRHASERRIEATDIRAKRDRKYSSAPTSGRVFAKRTRFII